MCITGTIRIANNLQTGSQRFLGDSCFGCPVTMKMGKPHVTTTDSEMTGVIAFKNDGFLFVMRYLYPRLNDINILVCLVELFHSNREQFVLHGKNISSGISLISLL